MKSNTLHVWLWPVVLGVSSASGLLSALVSDGWGDVWSWLALGLPVAVMGWFSLRRPGQSTPPAQSHNNEFGSQR